MFAQVRLTRAGKMVLGGGLALAAIAVVSSITHKPATPQAQAAAPTPPLNAAIERGRYLVTISGCNDCHTPFKMGEKGPEPDMTRMLSGHPQDFHLPTPPKAQGPWIWSGSATNTAFSGPWGVSYAANLTPDTNTGMGIWTEDMFIKAMRTGRHFGEARPIAPPMPWQSIGKMTDDDLKAVYAYLRSIPKVKNLVPDYHPPEEAAKQ